MGMPKEMSLQGNDFSNVATAFSVAYLVAEIPNGLSDSEILSIRLNASKRLTGPGH